MAVKEYNPRNARYYIGASSDTKPTGTSTAGYGGVQAGDKFLEQDTGKVYVYGTDGAWHVVTSATASYGAVVVF